MKDLACEKEKLLLEVFRLMYAALSHEGITISPMWQLPSNPLH